MTNINFILLYVNDPAASGAYYAELLGRQPVETSLTFVMFKLPAGLAFGLWSKHTVEPRPAALPGAGEIAFVVPDPDAVHAEWAARGITIVQPPTTMDFGRAFLAQDPDGHRLRVFKPA